MYILTEYFLRIQALNYFSFIASLKLTRREYNVVTTILSLKSELISIAAYHYLHSQNVLRSTSLSLNVVENVSINPFIEMLLEDCFEYTVEFAY